MHRWILASSVLALMACATAPAKMSFRDAFPEAPASTAPAPDAPARTQPQASALASVLHRFDANARRIRSSTPMGSAMPTEEVDNWSSVLVAVDALLASPMRAAEDHDLHRARATLDDALELDARSYGDLPLELAQTVLDRVAQLSVRVAELHRMLGKPPVGHLALSWPVEPTLVTSLFGNRFHPILKIERPHQGIDLAAQEGQLVNAAAEGTVVRAAMAGAHGFHVEILHGRGVVTGYSHLSKILVTVGERVERGEPIGLAGHTGQATGTHLHFELWRAGRPRDPLQALRSRSPRLESLALAPAHHARGAGR